MPSNAVQMQPQRGAAGRAGRLRTLGPTPTGTSAEHLASDFGYWGKIVRELNVKVE
jgi:hypothetical protein